MRSVVLVAALTISASCMGASAAAAQQDPNRIVRTIDRSPVLAIDSRGAEPLFDVRSVATSPSRVVVAEGRDNVVSVYDAGGRFLHVLGREGAGPGEFEQLSSAFALPGDSVLTFDAGLRRYQVFDARGQYRRGFSLRGEKGAPVSLATPLGILNSGLLVVQRIRSEREDGDKSGVSRALIDVLTFRLDGEFVGTLATVLGWEAYSTSVEGVVIANTPIPFGQSTHLAAGGPITVMASSDSNMVRVYSANGEPTRIVRGVAPPGPAVASGELASFKERVLESTPAAMRQRMSAVYAEMPFPKRKAPFRAVYAGSDGTIWVLLAGRAEAPKLFRVLDQGGRELTYVELPAELRPTAVSAASVTGVWTDELGTESVRRYRLRAK